MRKCVTDDILLTSSEATEIDEYIGRVDQSWEADISTYRPLVYTCYTLYDISSYTLYVMIN
jgi:hypothetical protein